MKEINLEKLPEEAKKELIDFYEFLLQKYAKKRIKKTVDEIIPKKVKPFKPLKREEIYDR
ncbi:DUF2281 domain-containing protein [Persephonella sp. KM09-Lau-8]|uniref:DUF2281 domain-containing protein n=1 Tax=Persephonella sp. KM09-Lau-8 TaxID=1158345 RepID=UPI000496412E|nr:DUF2281 domain-containing protein [Persephonella sp. KM09-Lau-8]